MARARNIKPALFKNELLGQADPLLTVLFIGLWTLADRRGILEDRPLRIKAEVLPYRDGTDIAGYITELERLGFVYRFEARGTRLIHILNFEKHQNPHPTEKPSDLPGLDEKVVQKQDVESTTVITPLSNGSVHVAAVLIPSSLIPSSLIPDKPSADKPARFDPASLEFSHNSSLTAKWVEWITYRRKKKVATTEATARKQFDALTAWALHGHDPVAILETSMLNGWAGLFEPKAKGPTNANSRTATIAALTGYRPPTERAVN